MSFLSTNINAPSIFEVSQRVSSCNCLYLISLDNYKLGYLIGPKALNVQIQIGPLFQASVEEYLPNNLFESHKEIAFLKWLNFSPDIKLPTQYFELYQLFQPSIIKSGYFLPFSIVEEGSRHSKLNRRSFFGAVFRLLIDSDADVLTEYNQLLSALYGGKVNESYFNIVQLNDQSWLERFHKQYGIKEKSKEGYLPNDYPNPIQLMEASEEGSFGYAFSLHMKDLPKPLFYYFEGVGLGPYIRTVLGPAHDAHHPILGFGAEIYEEIGILSFYTFYDYKYAEVPTFWAPGVVGLTSGILKGALDHIADTNVFNFSRSKAMNAGGLSKWITNAWLGSLYAKHANPGFYSYPWLSETTYKKDTLSIRHDLNLVISRESTELCRAVSRPIQLLKVKRLLHYCINIMYQLVICDNPIKIRELLPLLEEQLLNAVIKIHGRNTINAVIESVTIPKS